MIFLETEKKKRYRKDSFKQGFTGQKEKKAEVGKKYNHLLSDFLPGNLGEQAQPITILQKSPEKILRHGYKGLTA